jgi:hypothetical protein
MIVNIAKPDYKRVAGHKSLASHVKVYMYCSLSSDYGLYLITENISYL